MSERNEKEINIEHPLEEILNIEEGSTIVPRIESTTELTVGPFYDGKDQELDEQIQEIYDAAMSAFETQMEESEMVEGKYKARNSEVAVQFLNAALNATKEKSHLKQHKDKTALAQNKLQGPSTVNNNLVVADRNDLLKKFFNKDDNKETEDTNDDDDV